MGTVDPGLSACGVQPLHPISTQDLPPSSFSSPQKLLQGGKGGSSATLLVFLVTQHAPQMSLGTDRRLVSATTRWNVWPWEAAWLATASSNGTNPSVRVFVAL